MLLMANLAITKCCKNPEKWMNVPQHLTLMLRVANLAHTKWCKKPWKITETLANGYSYESTQWELSNEYQHDSVKMVFKNLCIFVLWMKVASALEGLVVCPYAMGCSGRNPLCTLESLTCDAAAAEARREENRCITRRGGRRRRHVSR